MPLTPNHPWRDRLPKAPLDLESTAQKTGVQSVFAWIELFNGFQAELPEPYAEIDVLDGPHADVACEALRSLKRNPRLVRFAGVDMAGNRLWNVNPVLKEIARHVYPGTALDLGCGAGRDAVWLAANGWEVTAVDRLESNIETLRKLRQAYAENDPIHWVQANLHEYPPEHDFNLVLLHFCWDPQYFELAKSCVKPQGLLSVLAHSSTHVRCFAGPRSAKILVPESLKTEGFEVLCTEEHWARDRHFVSVVLQRH